MSRDRQLTQAEADLVVSIHAARMSRDAVLVGVFFLERSFNPRGSYEPRRRFDRSLCHSAFCFNPRGSYEPRLNGSKRLIAVFEFQSTRLV